MLRHNFQGIANAMIWQHMLRALAAGTLLFATYIAIAYIDQPLADVHAFRQTQTALTAYWMVQEGWALAYQTPVAGFPWAIPFEFPIYQTLVAALASLTGIDLAATGRFVSYAFLVACVWPAVATSKRLNLPGSVPWVFAALLFSSPLNLYWGRTFMIETTALFFSFACIPYAMDVIRGEGAWRSVTLFVLFASGAVLQKSTTGGPVLLFLLLASVVVHIKEHGFDGAAFPRLVKQASVITLPLLIGLAWAYYADMVKAENPFGTQLTSKVLTTWNFGTLGQRFDPSTWRLVLWERSLRWNAAGVLGVSLLLLPWLTKAHRRFAWLSLIAVALFLLPVLLFTNLHIVHEYYQVACVTYLLAALAIAIGGWLKAATGISCAVPLVTLIIVVSNIAVFKSAYGIVVARTLDELDPRSVQAYKVGRYLNSHTREGTALVIFGQDYSSEIAFHARRKAMTASRGFKGYRSVWEQPQSYLGGLELAAIVICPPTSGFPNLDDLRKRMATEPSWIHVTVQGCEILLSPTALALPVTRSNAIPIARDR